MATQPATHTKNGNGNKGQAPASKPADKGKHPMQTTVETKGKPAQATVFGEEPAAETEAPKPAVEISKEAKRALLDKVFAAEKAIKDAEDAVTAAKAQCSKSVRELVAQAGAGPWKVDGVLIKARLYGKDGNDYACLVRPNDTSVEEL